MASKPALWNGGRMMNVPGMSRDNAPSQPIDQSLIARVSGTVRNWLGLSQATASSELPFFPPGKPLDPIAPSAVGRRFDYQTNYNATIRPRTYEPIDFETLRALAEPGVGGWDLIRMAVETRKDQMAKLTYSILPRKPANVQVRPKSDKRCEQVETFLHRPDGQHSWADWIRMLVEEHLVIDAATIYKHPTITGAVAKLELIDGATIKPIVSYDGRRPQHGEPAYTQVLKGLPAVEYTTDELIYAPRNPRTHKVYGYSPVEQVLVTINIGLRRQVSQLAFFTEGSVPDAVAAVPADWSTQKIAEFQDYWDTIVNDAVRRRKLKFIPGGVEFQRTRNDQALVDAFDEWLARIVQYCFSLPPTPLVKAVNRATAESAYDQSLDEGLQPLMIWVKNIVDDIITRWFGFPDLEMVWDDIKKVDPQEKEQRDLVAVEAGVISRDDIRADRGLEPLGIPPVVQGIGPLGFMSITSMIKAIQNGWDLSGMPQPGLGGPGLPGMPGAGGPESMDPTLLGTGQDGDPLQGLPPDILEALGVAPAQPQPPGGGMQIRRETIAANSRSGAPLPGQADVSAADLRNPGKVGAHAAAQPPLPIHKHPAVVAALQQGERHAKKLAARMQGAS
jgi:phage portal protein BeeE